MHRSRTLRRRAAALALVATCGAACAMTGSRYGMPSRAQMAPSGAPVAVAMNQDSEASAPAPMTPSAAAQSAVANAVAHGPAASTTPGAANGGASNAGASSSVAATDAPSVSPMLIYTGNVDVAVRRAEVTATLDRVVELAYSMGGYLVQRGDLQVQVRIPSARFREGVRRLEDLGEVLHRSITAEDVSEEFNDLEVRLTNLRAVRHRLEEFLTRAANVRDALQVEQELERVSRDIDRIEGRMRFLRARATDSLLIVTVHPRAEVTPVPDQSTPAGRRPLDLPVDWLDRLGLGRLLQIR